MAINISLYQMDEDEKVVPKTLGTAVSTHTITLKDGCSIDTPTIRFSAGSAIMSTLNYAYIDAFGRYYYIRDRKMTVNGVCEMTLESDPLQSFYTDLFNVEATITRQEAREKANAYLIDGKYMGKAYQQLTTRDFPNSLDDFSYILMCVG